MASLILILFSLLFWKYTSRNSLLLNATAIKLFTSLSSLTESEQQRRVLNKVLNVNSQTISWIRFMAYLDFRLWKVFKWLVSMWSRCMIVEILLVILPTISRK